MVYEPEYLSKDSLLHYLDTYLIPYTIHDQNQDFLKLAEFIASDTKPVIDIQMVCMMTKQEKSFKDLLVKFSESFLSSFEKYLTKKTSKTSKTSKTKTIERILRYNT